MEMFIVTVENKWRYKLLSFISIFNLIIFIIFTVFYSYQIFYVFVALFNKSKNFNASINHKYAVVIAARNESAVIAQLILAIIFFISIFFGILMYLAFRNMIVSIATTILIVVMALFSSNKNNSH